MCLCVLDYRCDGIHDSRPHHHHSPLPPLLRHNNLAHTHIQHNNKTKRHSQVIHLRSSITSVLSFHLSLYPSTALSIYLPLCPPTSSPAACCLSCA